MCSTPSLVAIQLLQSVYVGIEAQHRIHESRAYPRSINRTIMEGSQPRHKRRNAVSASPLSAHHALPPIQDPSSQVDAKPGRSRAEGRVSHSQRRLNLAVAGRLVAVQALVSRVRTLTVPSVSHSCSAAHTTRTPWCAREHESTRGCSSIQTSRSAHQSAHAAVDRDSCKGAAGPGSESADSRSWWAGWGRFKIARVLWRCGQGWWSTWKLGNVGRDCGYSTARIVVGGESNES